MKKKSNKFLFWAPRILIILFALFLGIFSFDVFDGGYGFWGTALAFFMHNIPSFVLLIILAISWKHDLVGAIIFMALGALCVIGVITALLALQDWKFNPILIIGSVVFLLIGSLFLAGVHLIQNKCRPR